jgi:hypothetical protein
MCKSQALKIVLRVNRPLGAIIYIPVKLFVLSEIMHAPWLVHVVGIGAIFFCALRASYVCTYN